MRLLSQTLNAMSWWTPQLNAVLGTMVVMVGGWFLWGLLPLAWNLALISAVMVLLLWRGKTIGAIWAWSTLILGIESLAWPIVTMIQVRLSSMEPSDEDMGMILNAVLFGLFSSVFWISFAAGLFKRLSTPAGVPLPSGEIREEKKDRRWNPRRS